MPSPNFIAQAAHVGWGALFPLIAANYHHILWGVIGSGVYITLKEFIFDKYIEQQPLRENLKDWLYWSAGAAAGVGIILIH